MSRSKPSRSKELPRPPTFAVRSVRGIVSMFVMSVLVAGAGLWWFDAPRRTVRQAADLIRVNPERADTLASAAVDSRPSVAATAWLVRSRALLAMNRPLEALGAFAQIKNTERCDPLDLCLLAEEAQATQEFLLADFAASAALKQRTNRLRILTVSLPLKVESLPDTELAGLVSEFQQLVGERADGWRAIGFVQQARGHFAEAIEAYRRAVQLSPVSQTVGLQARRESAQLLILMGEYASARSVIDEVFQSGDVSPEDQWHRAQVQRFTGQIDEAVNVLNQVIESAPRHVAAQLLLGTIRLERNELHAARSAFENCLQIAPFHAESHYRLSQTLRRLEDQSAADRHSVEHRRLTELTRQLMETSRRREAAPDDIAVLEQLANLHRQLGQQQRAESLERAAQRKRGVASR